MSTIGRADLDGRGGNQSFLSASGVHGIAVEVDETHIYWADFVLNTIGRAKFDGTAVNQSFSTGASGPQLIAVSQGTFLPSVSSEGPR